VEAELAALAASGATTLVGAMVSDSWNQVKQRVGALFARGGSAQPATEELDLSRGELVAAREAGDDDSAADVETEWRVRLRRLLQADPDAAEELRSLLEELSQVAAPAQAGSVHNSFSGVVHGGSVFQGRDFQIGAPAPVFGDRSCED